MIRFLCALFKINYETCKSCETLSKQLEYEVSKNKELTETLISILKPKTYEAPPVELNQVSQTGLSFGRRRAALEARDREEARVLRDSPHVAKISDKEVLNIPKTQSVEELEQELGVDSNAP